MRTWFGVTLVAVALTFIALGFDAYYAATRATRELRSARDHLQQGADALTTGLLADARTAFGVASDASARAKDALEEPAARLAAVLPWIGDDVDAVRALADASVFSSEAAEHLADAANAAGWDGGALGSFHQGAGGLVRDLGTAIPDLLAATQMLDRATATVRNIDDAGLISPVRDAVDAAQTTLAEKDQLAHTATSLAQLLPGFLGTDGTRRYLVISQNLSDPRGSGGFPGDLAVLTAKAGDLHLSPFADINTLMPVKEPISAPLDVVNRYTSFGALDTWRGTTYSPDFPTSARLLLSMWRATKQPKMNGVISVDSVWTSYVLGVLGSVKTRAWPLPITSKNVSTIIGRHTFEAASAEESNTEQSLIGAAIWDTVLDRPIPPRPMGEAMVRAARERHLQIFSTDPDEEVQLQALGASGALDMPENPLMVSWFGGTLNRAGYFADKAVAYEARLLPDGSANVSVTITLKNTAPDGPPSILLGGGEAEDGVPVGTYGAYANLYLPTAGIFTGTTGDALLTLKQEEFGHPVVMQYLQADSRQTVTTTIDYSLPDAVRDGEFLLDVLPLPALNPDHVSVTIQAPQSSAIAATSPDLSVDGTSAHYDGSPVTPIALWVRLG